ncbi:hypothetical protein BDV19DRAFT_388664 [Aspergillus venezuelensis]
MPPLTSQEYVDEIQFRSRDPDPNTPLSKCLSGFPRWIGQEHYPPGTEKPDQFMAKSGQPHDLVVVHTSGDDGWVVQKFSQSEVSSFTTDVRAGPDDRPGQKQVILVRGLISPAWVAAIGSKYDFDPEFFRRHLDFLPGESYDADPLIESPSSCGMYRLCLSSIYETGDPDNDRDDTNTDTDLDAQRENQTAEIKAYKERLGSTDVWCGASMVRDYSILCPRYSVMEQYVSICVKESENDDCWSAIIWTDQGLPLTKSPLGPWPAADHPFLHPPPVIEWTASYPHSSFQATGKHSPPPSLHSLLRTSRILLREAPKNPRKQNLGRKIENRSREQYRQRCQHHRNPHNHHGAGYPPTHYGHNARPEKREIEYQRRLQIRFGFRLRRDVESATQSSCRKESETINALLSQYSDLEDSCKDLRNTCCSAINFAATVRVNAEQRECNQKMRRICKQHKRFLIVVTVIIV